MATAVANRYARALADLAIEEAGRVEPRQMVEELQSFEGVLSEAGDLAGILANPAVPPARKHAVVARLAEMIGCGPLVRNLLYVLVDRRRITALPEIRAAFEGLLDEHLGLLRVEVASAGELSPQQRGMLEERLSGLVGKQVRCEYAVDEELLGGAVVRFASTVFDGSVKGRLEALGNRLAE